MVDRANGLVAYGWADGNLVHFLTTADGCSVSSVTQRVGKQKVQV